MAWLTASKLRLTARHDGGRLKQIPFGYPTDRFFAIRGRHRFARCVAWRESLRLRRAMNNAPPFWVLPVHVIAARPGARRAANAGRLDQPQDSGGVWRTRGYGSPVAQRLHRRRGRSAAGEHRARPASDEE